MGHGALLEKIWAFSFAFFADAPSHRDTPGALSMVFFILMRGLRGWAGWLVLRYIASGLWGLWVRRGRGFRASELAGARKDSLSRCWALCESLCAAGKWVRGICVAWCEDLGSGFMLAEFCIIWIIRGRRSEWVVVS